MKHLIKAFFTLLFSVLFLLFLFLGLVYIGAFGPIPTADDLKDIKNEQATRVYSGDGVLIGKYFAQNRTNVKFDQLPQNLVDALIATEDARFYDHKGVDGIALLRVLVKSIIMGDRSAGGGSTITQQLAKNLFGRNNYGPLTLPVNKSKEIILANRLEEIYTKEEIIELYFNTVPFGENTYGVESAALRYFSKPVSDLTINESAVLVGMLKANTYYNPHLNPKNAKDRRNVVFALMEKHGYIEKNRKESLQRSDLKTRYTNLNTENPTGYFLNVVRSKAQEILKELVKPDGGEYSLEKDGLIVKTTLNNTLQQSAIEARNAHMTKLQDIFDKQWKQLTRESAVKRIIQKEIEGTKRYKMFLEQGLEPKAIMDSLKVERKMKVFDWPKVDVKSLSAIDSVQHYLKMLQAGMYAIEPKTGRTLVYVGGNHNRYLPYDLVTSKHQAASTFKPFLYAAALNEGHSPCEWIENEEKTYENYDNWSPQNYDKSVGGYYSMKGALAKSVNIPAVNTYFAIGHEPIESLVEEMGFTSDLPQNPSVALGTAPVSLKEMVRGYSAFSTRGEIPETIVIESIETADGKELYNSGKSPMKRVLTHRNADLMKHMLKTVVDSGTATSLKTRFGAQGDWAGKTGTAQNYSDAWFVGFNSNIVVGAWVGTRYPVIHFTNSIGSGSAAALPLVGGMIHRVQQKGNKDRYSDDTFPALTDSLRTMMNCPFYRDEKGLEKILDIFDRQKSKMEVEPESSVEEKEEKKEKKKGFFKRLFDKVKGKKD